MRALLALVSSAILSGCGARPCTAETTACGCYARRDECRLVTEACWCPSECDATIACVCGGGAFLRCESKAP